MAQPKASGHHHEPPAILSVEEGLEANKRQLQSLDVDHDITVDDTFHELNVPAEDATLPARMAAQARLRARRNLPQASCLRGSNATQIQQRHEEGSTLSVPIVGLTTHERQQAIDVLLNISPPARGVEGLEALLQALHVETTGEEVSSIAETMNLNDPLKCISIEDLLDVLSVLKQAHAHLAGQDTRERAVLPDTVEEAVESWTSYRNNQKRLRRASRKVLGGFMRQASQSDSGSPLSGSINSNSKKKALNFEDEERQREDEEMEFDAKMVIQALPSGDVAKTSGEGSGGAASLSPRSKKDTATPQQQDAKPLDMGVMSTANPRGVSFMLMEDSMVTNGASIRPTEGGSTVAGQSTDAADFWSSSSTDGSPAAEMHSPAHKVKVREQIQQFRESQSVMKQEAQPRIHPKVLNRMLVKNFGLNLLGEREDGDEEDRNERLMRVFGVSSGKAERKKGTRETFAAFDESASASQSQEELRDDRKKLIDQILAKTKRNSTATTHNPRALLDDVGNECVDIFSEDHDPLSVHELFDIVCKEHLADQYSSSLGGTITREDDEDEDEDGEGLIAKARVRLLLFDDEVEGEEHGSLRPMKSHTGRSSVNFARGMSTSQARSIGAGSNIAPSVMSGMGSRYDDDDAMTVMTATSRRTRSIMTRQTGSGASVTGSEYSRRQRLRAMKKKLGFALGSDGSENDHVAGDSDIGSEDMREAGVDDIAHGHRSKHVSGLTMDQLEQMNEYEARQQTVNQLAAQILDKRLAEMRRKERQEKRQKTSIERSIFGTNGAESMHTSHMRPELTKLEKAVFASMPDSDRKAFGGMAHRPHLYTTHGNADIYRAYRRLKDGDDDGKCDGQKKKRKPPMRYNPMLSSADQQHALQQMLEAEQGSHRSTTTKSDDEVSADMGSLRRPHTTTASSNPYEELADEEDHLVSVAAKRRASRVLTALPSPDRRLPTANEVQDDNEQLGISDVLRSGPSVSFVEDLARSSTGGVYNPPRPKVEVTDADKLLVNDRGDPVHVTKQPVEKPHRPDRSHENLDEVLPVQRYEGKRPGTGSSREKSPSHRSTSSLGSRATSAKSRRNDLGALKRPKKAGTPTPKVSKKHDVSGIDNSTFQKMLAGDIKMNAVSDSVEAPRRSQRLREITKLAFAKMDEATRPKHKFLNQPTRKYTLTL